MAGIDRVKRVCAASFAVAAMMLASATADAQAGSHAPKRFFGVHLRAIEGGDYGEMRRNHVGLIRVAFPLSIAKPSSVSPYRWTWFDQTVEGAARKGIDVLPVVYGVPSWIPGALKSILRAPVDTEWQAYLDALVERYGTNGDFWFENPTVPYQPITDWQLWNEPNSFVNWADPHPREYGRFLTRSARTLHRADPQAQVVSAGLVSSPINSDASPGATFLRKMLKSRATRRAVDVVAIHPYTKTVKLAKKLIRDSRKVMDSAGLKRTPIWVTEIGWGSSSPNNRAAAGQRAARSESQSRRRWSMTPAKQRKNLRRAFEMGLKQRKQLGIKRMVWYQWQDGADSACGWCTTSGLIRDNGKAKRLLAAFRRIAGG